MCRAYLFKYMICKHYSPRVLWTRCSTYFLRLGDDACPNKRKRYLYVEDLCWRCKERFAVTLTPKEEGGLAEWFWCVDREDYSSDFELDEEEPEAVLPAAATGGKGEEAGYEGEDEKSEEAYVNPFF